MKISALTLALLPAFAITALLAPAAEASMLAAADHGRNYSSIAKVADHGRAFANQDKDKGHDEDEDGDDNPSNPCHQYWHGHCADD